MWSVELLPIAVPLIRVLNTIPHATAATFINSDSFDINILASKFTNIKNSILCEIEFNSSFYKLVL